MIILAKVFQSAHQSVKEVSEDVNKLVREGYDPNDIVVVTIKENKEDIENLTNADVEEVPTEESKNAWDSVKDAFTQGDDEKNPLGKYDLDPETTEKYNSLIKDGGYVILTEEKPSRGNREDLNDSATSEKPGSALGNPEVPGDPGLGTGPHAPETGIDPTDHNSGQTPQ